MTTMQLRADIFENLNLLLDNEDAMIQLRKYLHILRKKVEQDIPCQYSIEELGQRAWQGVQDARLGMGQSNEDLMKEAETW
ncbi:hypothetical protein [uncultured Parabacteroides sp.]|uniref:hypothetical protein n=1 Tax=uncultured Parabacteroides sp. TaxID=512312 RepID=UPI002805EBFB|nr:hypothetical protein [uncultured Parabacteroides sp.]